jgi:hypothetical protein
MPNEANPVEGKVIIEVNGVSARVEEPPPDLK